MCELLFCPLGNDSWHQQAPVWQWVFLPIIVVLVVLIVIGLVILVRYLYVKCLYWMLGWKAGQGLSDTVPLTPRGSDRASYEVHNSSSSEYLYSTETNFGSSQSTIIRSISNRIERPVQERDVAVQLQLQQNQLPTPPISCHSLSSLDGVTNDYAKRIFVEIPK